MAKRGQDFDGSFFLLVDGAARALGQEYAGNSDGAPQGTATINLYLTAGQEVQVQNSGSTQVWGTYNGFYQTWITGFLIYAV